MGLAEKLLKNSTMKDRVSLLKDSQFFGKQEFAKTEVPMLNLALSGKLDGGLAPGLTVIAGPSKHFKSNYGLLMVAAYLKKYPDAVCLFYDSEFGVPPEYMANFGIDTSRVVHFPVTNIEELKFDIANQLEKIEKGEKVIVLVDSLGNLASKKEVEDALDQKSVADMQRSKHIKSLFRIVTPILAMKQLPMICINHTYAEMSLFGGQVVSGGTGVMYSADTVFIVGRAQEKDTKGLKGWTFTINIEKSRFVKEKSKIPVTVTFDKGVYKWSGIVELATELGIIGKQGDSHIKLYKEDPEKLYLKGASDEQLDKWFVDILENSDFKKLVEEKYGLSNPLPTNETVVDNEGEIE